jgi:putative tryptophan/tyrosine transport system substrate-binding protein
VKRREFITLLGCTAAWPLAARAQQGERMRRIGILMNTAADDPEPQTYVAAFRQTLQQLGWVEGRNVQFDTRWGAGSTESFRRYGAELVALAPDLIIAAGIAVVTAVQAASRAVPIVFAQAIDPVGAGVVMSLARPGGKVTGFMQFEYGLSGKWPELLKEIAPRVTRVAVLRDTTNPAGIGQWAVIQVTASSIGMEMTPLSVREVDEIEQGMGAFAHGSGGGLIVPVSARAVTHRQVIITQAARHRLPAIYPNRHFVTSGGLVSYGPDLVDQYRRAAGYVDRILKGEKPADLPVQAPTKYELVINLKTAKALASVAEGRPDVPPRYRDVSC